jgi:N,N-dimethylformamidase
MTRHRDNHRAAPVVRYTDRLSARPGERITVHASATTPECRVRVLWISHDGTGTLRTPVEVPAPVQVFVPHQTIDFGSYGLVENPPALGGAVTFAAWVWPTALPEGRAGVITQGEAVSGPFAAL